MYLDHCPMCRKELVMSYPQGAGGWLFPPHLARGSVAVCGSEGLTQEDCRAVMRMQEEGGDGLWTAAHP
jgi:hypothetical protein